MEHDRRKWHFDKSLNIGYLLTTFAMVMSVAYSAHLMSVRQALTEQTIETIQMDRKVSKESQMLRDTRQDADLTKEVIEIKEAIKDMNAKLDRMQGR